MKINILFAGLFLSIIAYASADFFTGISGATQLNGEGCLCHSLTSSSSVIVWIEGPDSVALGETVQYRIFMVGGPSAFGGFNVAARFNNLSPADSSVHELDGELTHNYPQPFPIAQPVSWPFNYTAVSQGWDTLYSVGNSVNGDSIPTEDDQWNFGEKFPVFVTPSVPVELVSFNAVSENQGILLNWVTATELNNKEFEIQRSLNGKDFFTLGFVKGNGTTTSPKSYSFLDSPGNSGEYFYRLKQLDFDGTSSYSEIVTADFILNSFGLSQNYPNPFNPETVISFSIPDEGYLNLKIYNILGEQVDILSDGLVSSGSYSIKWNASSFTSGVYFYKLDFESNLGLKISEVKKIVFAK
jgi:hypothetical protein